MKKNKASRAKKAAAAAPRNTAPSPPQELEPELPISTMPAWLSAIVDQFLRLLRMLTMPAWLSAIVDQFLRLLRMQTMPAWLSALVQRSQPVPVVAQVVPARKKQGKPKRKKQGKPKRNGPIVSQMNMYRFPRESPAARAWKEKPAARHLPPGPSISDVLAKYTQIVDPYEQEDLHGNYLSIRTLSKYGWDTCSVCYFEKPPETVSIKGKNLDRHFREKHGAGGACARCSVCKAMFFTRHLKWHTQYCHPGIAVKANLGAEEVSS